MLLYECSWNLKWFKYEMSKEINLKQYHFYWTLTVLMDTQCFALLRNLYTPSLLFLKFSETVLSRNHPFPWIEWMPCLYIWSTVLVRHWLYIRSTVLVRNWLYISRTVLVTDQGAGIAIALSTYSILPQRHRRLMPWS